MRCEAVRRAAKRASNGEPDKRLSTIGLQAGGPAHRSNDGVSNRGRIYDEGPLRRLSGAAPDLKAVSPLYDLAFLRGCGWGEP
jgi:hypothetical protein